MPKSDKKVKIKGAYEHLERTLSMERMNSSQKLFPHIVNMSANEKVKEI